MAVRKIDGKWYADFHLIRAFGEMRLDEIKTHPIELLKADLLAKGRSRKRVNNIRACLGKMLRYAQEVEDASGRSRSLPDFAAR